MKKVLLATLLTLGIYNTSYADSILDVAAADSSLSTLVTALKAAGLVDTLKGTGPFTIFAPNNAAFEKIPKDKLETLLKDKAALTKVLTYHVVAGNITPADVAAGKVKTVEGHYLTLSTTAGVKVNGHLTVGGGDIKADNGQIHVVDTVLMPTSDTKSNDKKKHHKK
ncbi:MAG: fasciclin domain-containing protein [Bdellovibrio sp.]|nr:fasciclin domain-containing protein [Methylotenera sp.]